MGKQLKRRVREKAHQGAPQQGGLLPQGQVDDLLRPLVQDGAQEDPLPLGEGDEGNPVPAVQVGQGPVGEVQKGHRTVGVQGPDEKVPAGGGAGALLPPAGDLEDLPLEHAPPGQGEGPAAQHQALRLVQPPGAGGDIGPEGLHVLEEPRLGVPRCRGHGGQAGVGLGEVGQQGGGGGGAAARPALPQVPVPLLVAPPVGLSLGAGDGEPFRLGQVVGQNGPPFRPECQLPGGGMPSPGNAALESCCGVSRAHFWLAGSAMPLAMRPR